MNTGIENFLAIKTKVGLAKFFGIDTSTLNYFLYKLTTSEKYDTFTIRKKSGGVRLIDAPIKPLKDIQKSLAGVLLNIYQPKSCVYSYVKSKSIKENAVVHEGQKWICRIDIKNFFSNIHIGRVIGLFQSKPFSFSRKIATLLAQICCKDTILPQGAPTSPIISNFICRSLDSKLLNLARRYRCKYSRYSDDIFFSTNKASFPSAICKLEKDELTTTCIIGPLVEEIFKEDNFTINHSKVVLIGKGQRQAVTGLIVNKHLNVPREYVRNIRSMLYSLKNDGLEIAEKKFHEKYDYKNRPGGLKPKFRQVLRGRIEYLGYIKGYDHKIYLKYAKELSELDKCFKFNKRGVVIEYKNPMELYAEGPTDYLHIEAALKSFQNKGEFTNLGIKFTRVSDINGDGDLLKFCDNIKKTGNVNPKVCLFDDDNKTITKKVEPDQGKSYKCYGNNVYAVITPKPPHRSKDKQFCIEMYYSDEDLKKTDKDGRRIYLKSEFDSKSGRNKSIKELLYTNFRSSSLIVDNNVFDLENKNVALSKKAFAQYIFDRVGDFACVDFEGFRSLFEVLSKIFEEVEFNN